MRRYFILGLAIIILAILTFLLGCGREVKVSYGYRIVCSRCGQVLEESLKENKVLVTEAQEWKVKTVKVPCGKDKKCNQKRSCKNCALQECQGEKPSRVASLGEHLPGFSSFLEEKSVSRKPVKFKSTPPTSPAVLLTSASETIRVGVYGTGSEVTVSGSYPFRIFEEDGSFLAEVSPNERVSLFYQDGRYHLTDPLSLTTSSSLRLVSSGQALFKVENMSSANQFRGSLELRYSLASQKLWVINELNLEDYLKGIGEEPESWSGISPEKYFEFLKASVVAFRSYALSVKGEGKRNKREPFDILNTSADQVYLGVAKERKGENLRRAVEATRGQTLEFGGQVARTPYFGSCDGKTRAGPKPWLVSVSNPYCSGQRLRGHGIGMCMHGAKELAKAGYSYQQILNFYYPGTSLFPK